MKRIMKRSVALVALGAGLCAGAETLLDLPVSAVDNPAYLASMSGRPWWNGACTRRAPLLVSSASEVPHAKALVDVVLDFGEPVNPADVRVVTPWETEVPCVAERAGADAKGGTIRLLFRTPLRIQENKPFLVYWGRTAGAKSEARETPRTYLTLDASEDEFCLANGLIEVVFDRKAILAGPIKSIRVLGSQVDNELLRRATGYAWAGFVFSADGVKGLKDGVVTTDNAFKKELRFSNGKADVTFTLAADAPRLDWRYELKDGAKGAKIDISWAVGGDVSQDDLVYPSPTGRRLLLRASLDQATDNIPQPAYFNLEPYVAEGWLAIQDHKSREAVGVLFDRAALAQFDHHGHGQASGEETVLKFKHAPAKGEKAAQSGSLVALMGGAAEVETEYRRMRQPLSVRLGVAEAYAEHPLTKPRFDHDFVADYNIGFSSGHGWNSGSPLSDPRWADNIMDRLRAYGANAARIGHYGNFTPHMKLSKDLYERVKAVALRPDSNRKNEKWPEWTPERYDGHDIAQYAAAAHRRGMGVSNWSTYMCLGHTFKVGGRGMDPELNQLDWELQSAFADSGVDVINCKNGSIGEGPWVRYRPDDGKLGSVYRKWPDPAYYFKSVAKSGECQLMGYQDAKRRHPEATFMTFHSENGEIDREMYSSEMIGSFDTAYVEMLPRGWMHHCKYVAKRMRAIHDNEPGWTMHHHFYFYDLTARERIDEVEMPFMCGVNGFSTENLTYEQHAIEYSEIPADFYRFAEYTKLGEKAARMAPVRDLAVFRDDAAFRADVVARRTVGRNPWDTYALGDRRVEAFGYVPNLAWDIVFNHFFTVDSLKRYRAVYLPSDEVFSDALADVVLDYVKQGGGAVIEGVTVTNRVLAALNLKDGEVRAVGKGKVVYLKGHLSESLARDGTKAWTRLRETIASVGAQPPYAVSNDRLDSILQASERGWLLSVYNLNEKAAEKATFTLNGQQPAADGTQPLFILDLKAGRSQPFAGTCEISVAPKQMAYYLIGAGDFAQLPKTVRVSNATGIASASPKGNPCQKAEATSFTPARAIEFVRKQDGKPIMIRRSNEAMIPRTAFTEMDESAFRKALKTATYVHFQQPDLRVWDDLFATCADDLKAFLARGGALFFDKYMPGKNAHAFLESVGVKDPTPTLATHVGDGLGGWDPTGETPTNTLLHAAITGRGISSGLNYSRVFSAWDKTKQTAPYRPYLAADHAIAVAQEGVLGKGKVLFQISGFTFTDHYDNRAFSKAVLSWLIGMPVDRHAARVRKMNGGPGEVVE